MILSGVSTGRERFFVRSKYQIDSKMKVIVSKCQHLEKIKRGQMLSCCCK